MVENVIIGLIVLVVAYVIYSVVKKDDGDTETPVPSQPVVSPSPTPTTSAPPSPSPTAPTVTPSSGALSVVRDTSNSTFVARCSGKDNVMVPPLTCSFTVDGGSGNYNIRQTSNCTSVANSLCHDVNVSIGTSGASLGYVGTTYNCAGESGFHDAVINFEVEDVNSGEKIVTDLYVSWEII